jgi:hypothetical protein
MYLRKLPTCCTVQVGGVESNRLCAGGSVSSRLTDARQPARTTYQNLYEQGPVPERMRSVLARPCRHFQGMSDLTQSCKFIDHILKGDIMKLISHLRRGLLQNFRLQNCVLSLLT